MLQKLKINTLNVRDYSQRDSSSSIIAQWALLFKTLKNLLLLAIPISAITLSILSDYLFFKEIASASFLIILISFIKIASGKS
ncbi:hypothetical protein DCS32_06910 [Dokdonia sp. Dokd-P16]|uniref:hypothetical protein n=1 Tax=Dokdonia sp. Dokd-P16 TaxID=2173169 RepID=UPI000D548B88|nr:hypothetical protein [Dokdonia sp. Dokd-P16]AWH73894.1 hypothetical protein DCS32_06910 [Dokdonia sp. Dokd-P16]